MAGKGQLLMGGGGFRWADQAGWNVAGLGDLVQQRRQRRRRRHPGLGLQPADARRHRPRPRPRAAAQRRHRPDRADDHVTSPLDGAKSRSAPPDRSRSPATTTTPSSPARRPTAAPDRSTARRCRPAASDVGPHTIVVTARDAAGNMTTKRSPTTSSGRANGGVGGTVPAALALTLGPAAPSRRSSRASERLHRPRPPP